MYFKIKILQIFAVPMYRLQFGFVCLLIFISFSLSGQNVSNYLQGNINNYTHENLTLYKCYADTLIFLDSVKTDDKGFFIFPKYVSQTSGLYKAVLKENQFFYVIFEANGRGWESSISTTYKTDVYNNIATDSLKFNFGKKKRKVPASNEIFYRFQKLQHEINIANYLLMPMMRHYPLTDAFHPNMEAEYKRRYEAMKTYANKINSFKYLGGAKLCLAYYQPVVPDWKKPDPWRDSIIASHFFDYFNPADSFFLQTNILPEKMDIYLSLRTNKRDEYGQVLYEEKDLADAATDFLNQMKKSSSPNQFSFDFCLNYFLNMFDKEKKEAAFLSLYDRFLNIEGENCEIENDTFKKFRETASKYRGVRIGIQAPNFEIKSGSGDYLYKIKSDFTLLIFWATWCPHCKDELVKIKKILGEKIPDLNQKGKIWKTIAISLDTDEKQWQDFITKNTLNDWTHFSELKSWNSTVVRQYNIYATPTMFLLDKDKKIIHKPISARELEEYLRKL